METPNRPAPAGSFEPPEREPPFGPGPDGRRYGEREIDEARLEAVPNPALEHDYLIHFVAPEFTCLCPRSGFPDFATIRIRLVPDQSIVELRSLKLYFNSFRSQYLFHELVPNRIADDLVELLKPHWIEVVGDFTVRGNIKTVITTVRVQAGYRLPDYLRDQLFSTLRERPSSETV